MAREDAKLDTKQQNEHMRKRRLLLQRMLRGALYVSPVVAVLGMRNLAAAQASGPMMGP